MPILATRGAIAARNYGLFSKSLIPFTLEYVVIASGGGGGAATGGGGGGPISSNFRNLVCIARYFGAIAGEDLV